MKTEAKERDPLLAILAEDDPPDTYPPRENRWYDQMVDAVGPELYLVSVVLGFWANFLIVTLLILKIFGIV